MFAGLAGWERGAPQPLRCPTVERNAGPWAPTHEARGPHGPPSESLPRPGSSFMRRQRGRGERGRPAPPPRPHPPPTCRPMMTCHTPHDDTPIRRPMMPPPAANLMPPHDDMHDRGFYGALVGGRCACAALPLHTPTQTRPQVWAQAPRRGTICGGIGWGNPWRAGSSSCAPWRRDCRLRGAPLPFPRSLIALLRCPAGAPAWPP